MYRLKVLKVGRAMTLTGEVGRRKMAAADVVTLRPMLYGGVVRRLDGRQFVGTVHHGLVAWRRIVRVAHGPGLGCYVMEVLHHALAVVGIVAVAQCEHGPAAHHGGV